MYNLLSYFTLNYNEEKTPKKPFNREKIESPGKFCTNLHEVKIFQLYANYIFHIAGQPCFTWNPTMPFKVNHSLPGANFVPPQAILWVFAIMSK